MIKSNTPLRLGFIGGSPQSAAGYAHFVAARMDKRFELTAGAFSKNRDTNIAAAQTYGVAPSRTYQSLQELLVHEASCLDALAILTPTPQHYAMVIDCLEAGMPVICEKSLCCSSEEANVIQELCAKKGGFVAVVYNYSGYPMVREIRSMIQEGVLGDLLHFQAEMPQEGYIRTDENGAPFTPQVWRLEDGPVPTIHLDLAVHLHELIHYLTGLKPQEAMAVQSSKGWFNVIDNVMCISRYESDMMGQYWFSKSALGCRNGLRLRIFGSKASAEWLQMAPEEVILSFADGRRQILDRASAVKIARSQRYQRFKAGHPAGFNEALGNLYVDMYEALHNYKRTGRLISNEVFGADLAYEGLLLMEAMARSSKSAQWEQISIATNTQSTIG